MKDMETGVKQDPLRDSKGKWPSKKLAAALQKVSRAIVERIFTERAGQKDPRGGAWSAYIIYRYRMTGSLAPGCDAKDFNLVWADVEATARATAAAGGDG